AVKSAAGSDVKSAPNAAAATALNIVPDAEAETAIFAPTVAGKPDTGLAEAAPVTQVGLSAKTPALEALLTPPTAAIAPERAGVPELIRFDQALPQELREVNATAKETTFNASTDKPAPTSRLGEAVMAQIKSAQVEDGRTHIALKPSGLGQIEIVIQTTEDAASKVIVKVDNPAVLTTLRDDRQYLAQAIGVSDGTTLEFQSGSSSQDSSEEHAGQGGFTGFEDMGTSEPVIAAPQSRIIEDTSLDITT
ncbi:MAG: hypothetical protein HRU30_10645, partial [Rhodobacteraceae bacterium]|nr:hypothetical protein [Paracoccaceae bacterium]